MTKMQDSMKEIAKHLNKMQETQQLQATKIKILEQERAPKRKEKDNEKV